jgi:hypothetical protein
LILLAGENQLNFQGKPQAIRSEAFIQAVKLSYLVSLIILRHPENPLYELKMPRIIQDASG